MNKFAQRWKQGKGWNPFSAEKLFAHIYRWRRIKRGSPVPSPAWVTVDPSNLCNLDCVWCNSKSIRELRNTELSYDTLMSLAEFLPSWGVEAVTIAGGGEPLTNPSTGNFIDALVKNGVQVGVITNGTLMDEFLPQLSKCVWVSVSIDAGNQDTYKKLKGGRDVFNSVIANTGFLVEYSKYFKGLLTSDLPAYGVTYKYLLHPGNVHEVHLAAKIAKNLGCKNICYRPAVTPYQSANEITFSNEDIGVWDDWMKSARELDDENFNVYEYTYRVGEGFKRDNCFDKCWAVFMSGIIQPSDKQGAFNFGLCCDRRGDKTVDLLRNEFDVNEIHELWGKTKHWGIHDSLDHTKCPQCTHIAHNQVYEQAILNDCLTYRFI
jgi:MoaA/NifB/PqqE/SkfB family radical SAM enzyme